MVANSLCRRTVSLFTFKITWIKRRKRIPWGPKHNVNTDVDRLVTFQPHFFLIHQFGNSAFFLGSFEAQFVLALHLHWYRGLQSKCGTQQAEMQNGSCILTLTYTYLCIGALRLTHNAFIYVRILRAEKGSQVPMCVGTIRRNCVSGSNWIVQANFIWIFPLKFGQRVCSSRENPRNSWTKMLFILPST